MSDFAILVLGAALVLSALIVAFAVLRRPQKPKIPQEDQNAILMREQVAALSERLKAMAEHQTTSHSALTKVFEERLANVSQNMGKNLAESATKTAETLGKLNNRLNVIDEAQKNITELSGQVVNLQDLLGNKQARGAFGEVQLVDIVSNALPPSAYKFQASLSNGTRPDCILDLPNPPGAIVIDAKFPLESYQQLREAEDDQARSSARRAFKDAILKHVKDISTKYVIPGETAESALMFLPSEAIYAELHTNFTEVVRQSYEMRVWIVSPTTLMATLNTVRAVLKDVRMREQAHIIQREVGMLSKDVGRLDTRVGKLASHFAQVNKDISDITTSTGKIINRAGKIEELQLEEDEGPSLSEVENIAPLKQIS